MGWGQRGGRGGTAGDVTRGGPEGAGGGHGCGGAEVEKTRTRATNVLGLWAMGYLHLDKNGL